MRSIVFVSFYLLHTLTFANQISLATEPGGAEIWVNGQYRGISPITSGDRLLINLAPGSYAVEAKKPQGGTTQRAFMQVKLGGSGVVRVQLNLASSSVAANPQIATIKVGGLEWMRCSLGQTWSGSACTGNAQTFTYHQAIKQAEAYNAAFQSTNSAAAWRVPSVRELLTIRSCSSGLDPELADMQDQGRKVSRICANGSQSPTIDLKKFPNTLPQDYWSATPYPGLSLIAWYVNFYSGFVDGYFRGDENLVRLVRNAQ